MAKEANVVRRGIYNVEYFSGAQVSLYIGDIWVDEITTLSYGVMQSRSPIYGYASELFDDVSEGHVLVQGTFTLNFKEAGYLWLVLNRFRSKMGGQENLLERSSPTPFKSSADVARRNIERIINHETTIFERNRVLQNLVISSDPDELAKAQSQARLQTRSSLTGFSSDTRTVASIDKTRSKKVGAAENKYEMFEDTVWRKSPQELDAETRRTDDPRLNPFEIFVAFGDFAGDNTANHTIERIRDVYILGKSKQIVIDGMPIQEQYSFIARNLV